jgi:sugar O-acyltransferase (sialic acid O-acetyltransferase NeuD family)
MLTNSAKKPLVIYGNGSMASALADFVSRESSEKIAAFTVDRQYINDGIFKGSPLIPFENISQLFPPSDFNMIIAVGYVKLNTVRAKKLEEARKLGYEIRNYISPNCLIDREMIVGENSEIHEGAIMRGNINLGSDVIIGAGAAIGHDALIGSHSFIAAGVITGGNISIGDYCVIGLGAILRDGISIVTGTFIGAGSVVVSDITEPGLYYGNPAKKQEKSPLDVV